jgi:hypothetical protein
MRILIRQTLKCGLEFWVATLDGYEIGQAWSRPGIVSVAKKYLKAHAKG